MKSEQPATCKNRNYAGLQCFHSTINWSVECGSIICCFIWWGEGSCVHSANWHLNLGLIQFHGAVGLFECLFRHSPWCNLFGWLGVRNQIPSVYHPAMLQMFCILTNLLRSMLLHAPFSIMKACKSAGALLCLSVNPAETESDTLCMCK